VTSGWIFSDLVRVDRGRRRARMTLHARLPASRLSHDTKEVIRLGAGLLATLAAVVISPDDCIRQVLLRPQDSTSGSCPPISSRRISCLRSTGGGDPGAHPDAAGRSRAIDRIWREEGGGRHCFTSTSLAEQLYNAVEALSPANDAQRALIKLRIMQASDEIARTRLLMYAIPTRVC